MCMNCNILHTVYEFLESEISKGIDHYNEFTFTDSKAKINAYRNIKYLLDEFYEKVLEQKGEKGNG